VAARGATTAGPWHAVNRTFVKMYGERWSGLASGVSQERAVGFPTSSVPRKLRRGYRS
jgi:hypothetical protein